MGTRFDVFFLNSDQSISIKRQISYRLFASQETFYPRGISITWDKNLCKAELSCKFKE